MRNQKNIIKLIELLLESQRIPVWGLALLMSYVFLILTEYECQWERVQRKLAYQTNCPSGYKPAGYLDCPALERCLTVLADCIRPTVRHTCRGTFTFNRRCVLVCLIYIARYIACVYRQVHCLYILSGILPTATCLLAPKRLFKQ